MNEDKNEPDGECMLACAILGLYALAIVILIGIAVLTWNWI